jgi:hypothetical protein
MRDNPVIDEKQLLAAIDDILRTMPPERAFRGSSGEILTWLGQASAIIYRWNSARGIFFSHQFSNLRSRLGNISEVAYSNIFTTLHETRHDLLLKTVGPMAIAVNQGSVFKYFDNIQKIVKETRKDLFFIDTYLDVDFVSRYLPYVSEGVTVRLLTKQYLSKLLPAVELFVKEHNLSTEVRSIDNLHDRYVFVDWKDCYQSGASFKDGPKKAPTTLTQIVDAFTAVSTTYEDMWTSATIEYKAS